MLEENGDLEYKGGNAKCDNIIRQWKEIYGLKYFFNYPGSLDLFFIENY